MRLLAEAVPRASRWVAHGTLSRAARGLAAKWKGNHSCVASRGQGKLPWCETDVSIDLPSAAIYAAMLFRSSLRSWLTCFLASTEPKKKHVGRRPPPAAHPPSPVSIPNRCRPSSLSPPIRVPPPDVRPKCLYCHLRVPRKMCFLSFITGITNPEPLSMRSTELCGAKPLRGHRHRRAGARWRPPGSQPRTEPGGSSRPGPRREPARERQRSPNCVH